LVKPNVPWEFQGQVPAFADYSDQEIRSAVGCSSSTGQHNGYVNLIPVLDRGQYTIRQRLHPTRISPVCMTATKVTITGAIKIVAMEALAACL